MPASSTPTAIWRRVRVRLSRPVFFGLTVLWVLWLLIVSWGRWIDPLVDFGAQLYIPWRITLGEHLGRDFVYPYGPLSSYLNAALFSIFGVALRTLVFANLVIFGGIFYCLYRLLRSAFGFLPAAVATLFGITVFGFCHLTGINNYTYAAPYAHEVTHGFFLLLLLVVRLTADWNRREPHGRWLGFLLGLIALTKVEIVFAAVVVLGCFVLARRAVASRLPGRWWLELIAVAAAVVAVAWAALAIASDARSAAIAVGSGSLAPFLYPAYAASEQGKLFLGVDLPLEHFMQLAVKGGLYLAVIAAISLAALGISQAGGRLRRMVWPLAGLGGLIGAYWLSKQQAATMADAFPVFLTVSALVLVYRWRRERRKRRTISARTFTQILLLVTAVVMMARMALAPRIFHYGFVQALIAGTWLVAFWVGEWPRFLAPTANGRRIVGVAMVMLVASMAVSVCAVSWKYYGIRTLPIGVGGDRIVGYGPASTEGHRNVELIRDYLVTNTDPSSTLLVAPEGIMLNYLTRRKTPLRITNLLPATLLENRRSVVAELAAHPPDRVLLITRMVNGDEILPFGTDEKHGRAILEWIAANYVAEVRTGADPLLPFLNPNDVGWILLKRKS